MDETVKILCVDDEPNVLKALTRLFMDENYEIFTASSGEEGLSLLAEQWDIQVVISDYRMPGLNGVDFLKAVHEGWPETIRIVLSGYADTAAVVAAINEGQVYKFIGKPWDDEALKATIAEAIAHYSLERKNQELTRQLLTSNAELQILNEDLEKAVADRTAEMLFRNQVLQQGQKILDCLPVGVVGIDSSGFIVQGNRRFYELTGQNVGTIMGQDVSQVFPAEVVTFIQGIGGEGVAVAHFELLGKPCLFKGAGLLTGDLQEGVVLAIDSTIA
ncbi:MAG: response regulator [Desulfobulbaceae bacterium]|nr:response regulator [Desulfobulbaceae bacterium]